MGVAALRHAALEVLRLSRPAHLGLIILSGDAELEAHTRDYLGGGGASAADKDLCEQREFKRCVSDVQYMQGTVESYRVLVQCSTVEAARRARSRPRALLRRR